MSSQREEEVDCPSCDHTQTVPVWDSVNVTIAPELKQRLFDGEINFFKCESCQYEAFISYPLLYHDMEQQFCVQFYPEEALDDEEFYDEFDINGKKKQDEFLEKFDKSGQYILEAHIVFDLDELLKYVIFRDNLFKKYGDGN